ncbi:MAG: hypothetical protein ABGX25_01950 [Nautiliaceae bacterium]
MKDFIKRKIVEYIKVHPVSVIVFFVGLFVGSYVSKVITWFPLIGPFIGFFITLGGGIGAVYILKKYFPNIK